MKKIFFDKLDGRNNKLLGIPMVVFVLIYVYTAFTDRDSNIHQISVILWLGFSAIFFGKQFFFKNYNGWNKKFITIKLNTFLSKYILFKDISSYTFENEILEIVRKDGRKFQWSLVNLRTNHLDKLEKILKANTIANKKL
ncbi:hypothetical protein [Robertkochia sediminum]|uniref:hypothetical protein n=1 Tax=Robertkochia sediminum TaxID=2785326 RepID=UPI0019337920|nr:hypothetical protein [Robertkochia sediminum]MBL7471212.1 hypothetical protein [Robertkochia sediminum]